MYSHRQRGSRRFALLCLSLALVTVALAAIQAHPDSTPCVWIPASRVPDLVPPRPPERIVQDGFRWGPYQVTVGEIEVLEVCKQDPPADGGGSR